MGDTTCPSLPLTQIRLPLIFVPIICFYYAIVSYQEPYQKRQLESKLEQAGELRNWPEHAFWSSTPV